jgi:hypothetical protein
MQSHTSHRARTPITQTASMVANYSVYDSSMHYAMYVVLCKLEYSLCVGIASLKLETYVLQLVEKRKRQRANHWSNNGHTGASLDSIVGLLATGTEGQCIRQWLKFIAHSSQFFRLDIYNVLHSASFLLGLWFYWSNGIETKQNI